MVCVAIVIVAAAVLGIFRQNMLSVLLESETEHMRVLGAALTNTLDNAVMDLRAVSENWLAQQASGFRSTVSYSSMQGGRFVLRPVPGASGVESNSTGILVHGDEAYLVCVLPPAGKSPKRALGLSLSGEVLRGMAHIQSGEIEIKACEPDGFAEGDEIRADGQDNAFVLFIHHFTDLAGNPARLVLRAERTIFRNGMGLVNGASAFLLVFVLGVLLALYALIRRYLVRRIEGMSADVRVVSGSALLNMNRYGSYAELRTLGEDINALVLRLEANRELALRSETSMATLRNILNGLDALVFVSDIGTDEILFINDKMRAEFGADRAAEGRACWAVLKEAGQSRCPACPNARLEQNPGGVITWEERSPVTRRIYRHASRRIDWNNDRRVCLQLLVDVTDAHDAEAALKRRLEQQELMAGLSQSFIGAGATDGQIARALKMAGEFMGIDRVLLARYAERELRYQYEWRNPDGRAASKHGAALPLRGAEQAVANSFVRGHSSVFRVEGEAGRELIREYELDVSSCALFGVFAGEDLWGFLEFDRLAGEEPWSPSDINLGEMVAGVLSGVLSRVQMETQVGRLSSIVESAPQFISFIDSRGEVKYFNPAASAVTGYSAAALRAGGLELTYGAESLAVIFEELLPAVQEAGRYTVELPLIRADGEIRDMSLSAFLLGDGPAGDVGIIGVDLTEIRRLEKDLILARDQAERNSTAKGEFLSRMSHEMRTPMNAIIGMANIARSADDPARKEYCLEKIRAASNHLLGVINDILDMSKIEANKFELSCADFHFERMLDNVVNVVCFRTDEKRQRLDIHVDPQMPAMVYGDEQRLAQVVTNLLTNAAKFTPEQGSISLTAKLLRRIGDELEAQVEVADTGIGISAEQQARLFHSFEQADGGIARRFGGTGLGLTISKRIVELMGGRIWVTSELGCGATFSFTMRLRAADAATEAKAEADQGGSVDLSGRRVLLAEDILINREIVLALLEDTGLVIDIAENGREAVERFASAAPPYDLILMDIQMPEVDGLEATRRIRALGMGNSATVPIIAMTANAFREDVENCLEAGMQAHIAKPVELPVLMETLRRYLR